MHQTQFQLRLRSTPSRRSSQRSWSPAEKEGEGTEGKKTGKEKKTKKERESRATLRFIFLATPLFTPSCDV